MIFKGCLLCLRRARSQQFAHYSKILRPICLQHVELFFREQQLQFQVCRRFSHASGTNLHWYPSNVTTLPSYRHGSCVVVLWKKPLRVFCSSPSPVTKKKFKDRKIVAYILERYSRYVQWYEDILQRRFPSAFKIYQIVKNGLRDLFVDVWNYLRIRREILMNGKPLRSFSRRELEVYRHLPRDFVHVLPLYCLQAIPFVGNVFFIVAYRYPKQLLSQQFWTPDQKMEFWLQDHCHRVLQYRIVMSKLDRKTAKIKDVKLRNHMEDLLHELHCNRHPSLQQIMLTEPLFVERPFGVQKVGYQQMLNLCKMHQVWHQFQPRRRLESYGILLRETDLAIDREGYDDESAHEVIRACFVRGLNPKGLHHEQRIEWLKKWVEVSQCVDAKSISLLLHCPIFLGLNEPTNRVLYPPSKS